VRPVTSDVAKRPPDLVVVVLDCVRALSFPGTGASLEQLPHLAGLRKEATVFTRAATVAPWTLPSHASLFTGRYPWEHGVMGDGRLQFDASVPTVPGMLREAGYASLALSANGLLTPLISLEGSFDAYRSAEWWEKTFRWVEPETVDLDPRASVRSGGSALSVLRSALARRRVPHPHADFLRTPNQRTTIEQAIRQGRPEEVSFGRWAESLSWATIDGTNRIARVLRGPDDPRPLAIGPWIEGTFEAWIRQQEPTRPIHCFMNLLDAHEKYLSDADYVRGLSEWLRFVSIPQNPRLWLQGEWQPSESELSLLRALYEGTIRVLDRRLGALIEVLQRSDRWRNTLLVVTSDHGQAFGEHGELFHERSPYQPLLHVPLWIRWPEGEGGGTTRTEPTSLIDIAPTLLRAAGVRPPSALPGVALGPAPGPARGTPILAMADGFPCIEHYRGGLSERAWDRLQHAYGVAYAGDFKVVLGLHDGAVQTFNLLEDPNESRSLPEPSDGDALAALEGARRVSELVAKAKGGSIDPTVQDRLLSWGY
jgi:arylsulfatase A-like enzyme